MSLLPTPRMTQAAMTQAASTATRTNLIARTPRTRRPRGYLLAEALVAGAVLASAIAITFTLIAQAQAGALYATHRQRAGEVARTKLEELASALTCTNTGATAFGSGLYTGTFTTTDVVPTSVPVIPVGKLCSASVLVNYPAAIGSSEDKTDAIDGNGKGQVRYTKSWARP